MNKWKKFTAACMGAAMVGTTAFGSSTVFADDTVTLDVWHQFTDPESAQTSAFEAAVKEFEKDFLASANSGADSAVIDSEDEPAAENEEVSEEEEKKAF